MKISRLTLALFGIMATISPAQSATDTTFSVSSVRSKDGTEIGYRRYGHGPGLILVQGAMGTAANYHQLALALANDVTVYVPDRRGRGLSPLAYSSDHIIRQDVEDIRAVLEKTDTHFVFGLSSGAIITRESARLLPGIEKVALYEPPFYVAPIPVEKIRRVYREIEQGKTGDAIISAFRVVKVAPAFFSFLPRFILRPMTKFYLNEEEQKGTGSYVSTRRLIPTMRYDFDVVLSRGDKLSTYNVVGKEVRLLGGSKSPRYLRDALDALEKTLPNARRTEFKGLDHAGPWNTDKEGSPAVVAESLIQFFKQPALTAQSSINNLNK